MKPLSQPDRPSQAASLPDKLGVIPGVRLSVEEVLHFVESFPALLWRIDLVKNQIEYLNRHQIGDLGDQSGLILQDMRFARRVVHQSDLHLLQDFMAAVRDARSAASVFRIQNRGCTRWIKLMGAVYAKDPRFYIGGMFDCSDTVAVINGLAVQETGNNLRASGNESAGSESHAPGRGRPADQWARSHVIGLLKKIEGKDRMEDILSVLLSGQQPGVNAEAIIYSDVYARKNKVKVYAAGAPLAAMAQGEVFPYEGTIAENIEHFKLEHLIVEDTTASIKAIDWALFIPHGIRSYFAKPFYDRKVLRTVLILCATERGAFSDQKIDAYALLYRPFLAGLKNWRKAARQKRNI